MEVRFTPARSHRFHLLDALRGIAALFVVPLHAPPELVYLVSFPNAGLAVDFFFCLSGFVIAYSYEGRLQARLSIRDFLMARAIRLYPMAILGTLGGLTYNLFRSNVWATLPPGGLLLVIVSSIAIFPMFGVSWFTGLLYPFNIPAWSLFSEIIANIVYATLVRFKIAQHVVLASISSLSLATLIYSLRYFPNLGGGFTVATAYVGFARVGFSFFVGVILFRLYQHTGSFRFYGKRSMALAVTIALLTILTLVASPSATILPYFDLFSIMVVFPSLVFLGSKTELSQRWTKLCSFLGDMSYPLYRQ